MEKEEKIVLGTAFSPGGWDERFNMRLSPTISIHGNKRGLEFFVAKISEYLESGDIEEDDIHFDVGVDLTEDSVSLDVVLDGEN